MSENKLPEVGKKSVRGVVKTVGPINRNAPGVGVIKRRVMGRKLRTCGTNKKSQENKRRL